MQKLFRIAVAGAAIVFASTGVVPAQNAPASGGTATEPAATTTAPAATSSDATTADKAIPKKKKKTAKMTRQQEIDRSIDNGTVPARYRSRVPKEYQQYIPFEKK
jgi:hypothetical protein